MVRPRSCTNCRSGWSVAPSIIACVAPGLVVFFNLRVGECRNVGAVVILPIPIDGFADRLWIVPGRLPAKILVRAIAVELQPVVFMRGIRIAFYHGFAVAPQPDHVLDDFAYVLVCAIVRTEIPALAK